MCNKCECFHYLLKYTWSEASFYYSFMVHFCITSLCLQFPIISSIYCQLKMYKSCYSYSVISHSLTMNIYTLFLTLSPLSPLAYQFSPFCSGFRRILSLWQFCILFSFLSYIFFFSLMKNFQLALATLTKSLIEPIYYFSMCPRLIIANQ